MYKSSINVIVYNLIASLILRNFIISLFLLITFTITSEPVLVFAHSGRTAADGCHYCRTNCDKWGEIWDVRHCHNGYTAPKIITPKPIKVEPKPIIIPTKVEPIKVIPKKVITPITPDPIKVTPTPVIIPIKAEPAKVIPKQIIIPTIPEPIKITPTPVIIPTKVEPVKVEPKKVIIPITPKPIKVIPKPVIIPTKTEPVKVPTKLNLKDETTKDLKQKEEIHSFRAALKERISKIQQKDQEEYDNRSVFSGIFTFIISFFKWSIGFSIFG